MLIGAKIHMRLIGSLSDEGEVRCLSAYLFMQGIQNHVDPVDQHFEIWVKDEDLLDQAKSCEYISCHQEFVCDIHARNISDSTSLSFSEQTCLQSKYYIEITLSNYHTIIACKLRAFLFYFYLLLVHL